MKLYKALLLGMGATLAMTSCSDWLEVNDNPNTPTDALATYEKRLPHIQFYTNDAYLFANDPICGVVGDLTGAGNPSTHGAWALGAAARETTCYQWWFVGAACNLSGLFNSAEAAGATHYQGVAHIIRAYGMGLMMDLHGEMPYEEALDAAIVPVYNTGSEMMQLTLFDIDKGLEYLAQPQAEKALPLSIGDGWGEGKVDKWVKFGNLLKARNLLHLYKKGAGSAADLKYDADAILAALEKSFKSVDDNMVIYHEDNMGPTRDVLGWSEPVDYCGLYSVTGMNGNRYFQKNIYDMLTDFNGCGIEDPRADRILPWAYSGEHADGYVTYNVCDQDLTVKFKDNWRRTAPIDMSTQMRSTGAPHPTIWIDGKFGTDKHQYDQDTIFVDQRSGGTGYDASPNYLAYRNSAQKKLGGLSSTYSGTFHTRATSPTWLGTYHEVCFIKAEVLFNKGDKGGAYAAYKEGVKAHMQAMNVMLKKWAANEKLCAGCPSFVPMTDAEINDYCEKALGTAGDITLGKIMTQKHIAMMTSVESWSDMRRYDYDENIFIGYKRPAERLTNSTAQLAFPGAASGTDVPRRWKVSSHEYRYNAANLKVIGAYLPAGRQSDGKKTWWTEPTMYSIPVWWDCADAPIQGPLGHEYTEVKAWAK